MKESLKFIISPMSILGLVVATTVVNIPYIFIATYDDNYLSTMLAALRISACFIGLLALPSIFYLRYKNLNDCAYYSLGGYISGFIGGAAMITLMFLSEYQSLAIMLVAIIAGLVGALAGSLFAITYWTIAVGRRINVGVALSFVVMLLFWVATLYMQRMISMMDEGLRLS